jgi:hypothetical protein
MNNPQEQSLVENAVVDLIRSRGVVGRAKYQTSMDRNDLKPEVWMQHFQEELADALQYGERLKLCWKLLQEARAIMFHLRDERGWDRAAEWIDDYNSQFLNTNNK